MDPTPVVPEIPGQRHAYWYKDTKATCARCGHQGYYGRHGGLSAFYVRDGTKGFTRIGFLCASCLKGLRAAAQRAFSRLHRLPLTVDEDP